MTSPVIQRTGAPAAVARRKVGRQAGQRLRGLLLVGLGAILLAANMGLLPSGLQRVIDLAWPAGLIALGLAALWYGPAVWRQPMPTYAVERGQIRGAHLEAHTGLADLHLRAFAGSSQLAVGQYPGDHGPRLEVEDTRATLALDRRSAILEGPGPWSAMLLKGVPWSMDLRSSLGGLHLDLRDLIITRLGLQSWAGNVELTLPAVGQGEMDLRLFLGDLLLRIPDGMGVKLRLTAGPLSRVQMDPLRFIETAPHEWVTPNFSTAPQRFTLSLDLSLGDLRVD